MIPVWVIALATTATTGAAVGGSAYVIGEAVKKSGDTIEKTGEAVKKSGDAALKIAVLSGVTLGLYYLIKRIK